MRWTALLLSSLLFLSGSAFADAKRGGQMVAVQGYQLEFLAEPETKGIHLHFYVMDAKDKDITNAQVKLQITAPDGTKTTLPLVYEAKEKSYVADLPMTVKGEYKVVALATLAGKKINARYAFKR